MNRILRITVVGLSLIAASSLALAVEGGVWWSMRDVSIGPSSSTQCFGGDCQPASLDWVGGSSAWIRYGVAAWAAGVISAACLVALAASLASRRSGRLIAKMVISAAVASAAAGAAFVLGFPGVAGMAIDRGVYLYFGGVAIAVAAAVVALRGARVRVAAPSAPVRAESA